MIKNLKQVNNNETYPYNVVNFNILDLEYPVVFFTGDNGSGKSTLLSVIAHLSDCINLGKDQHEFHDYSKYYKLSFASKISKGYYFLSEDFYTYLTWAKREVKENEDLLKNTNARHKNKESLGYIMESNLHKSNMRAMDNIVEDYLHVSHGEGYINFFASRLRKNSLYLLDEPESPLSFQNQLSLLSLIDEYTKQGSQFIICTHSPILLAYPNAKIYYFDNTIESIEYDEHPIVKDYQVFLNSPKRFMHHLLKD